MNECLDSFFRACRDDMENADFGILHGKQRQRLGIPFRRKTIQLIINI